MKSAPFTLLFLLATGCGPPARDTIRVGALFSMTGSAAESGFAQLSGARLAVDTINASGGIDGTQLQLVVRDDGTDKNLAVRAAQALQAEQLDVVVGTSTNLLTREALGVLGAETVLITPAATAPELSTEAPGDHFVRTCGTVDGEGRLFAERAFRAGFRRAALISSPRSIDQGLTTAFVQSFEQRGGAITIRQQIDANDESMAGLVSQTLASGADMVVLDVDTVSASHVLSAYAALKTSTVRWYLSHATYSEGLVDAVGARTLEGIDHEGLVFATPQGMRYRAFEQAWQQAFEAPPPIGTFAPQAFDAVYLIALARAKGGDLWQNVLDVSRGGMVIDAARWTEAVERARADEDLNFEGASGSLDLDANGDPVAPFDVWLVVDGQIRFMERGVSAPL
jgi:neutral amino acid transport system substrate-binding protein